jgi:comEA protein
MKVFFNRTIHSGWQGALGIFLILFGALSATFYYIEMHSISSGLADSRADEAAIVATRAAATPLSTPSTQTTVVTQGKIRISTATIAELDKLPGIGPVKAQAIIDYRNKKPFKSISDLQNVKGIGSKTLEKLKPLIEI